LSSAQRSLCEYAELLTRDPSAVRATHVERLREQGLTDAAIVQAAEVIAFFNYINRIAEGLGVDLEPDMAPHP